MWTTDKQPVCGVAATVGGGAGVVDDVVEVVLVGLVVVGVVVLVLVVLVVVLVIVVVEGAVDVVVDEVEVLVVGGVVDVPATPVGGEPGLVDRVRAVELTHACLRSPTVPV
jgi:hypothetical protein